MLDSFPLLSSQQPCTRTSSRLMTRSTIQQPYAITLPNQMDRMSTLVTFYARVVRGTTGAHRRLTCLTWASTIGSKVENSEDKVSQKDRGSTCTQPEVRKHTAGGKLQRKEWTGQLVRGEDEQLDNLIDKDGPVQAEKTDTFPEGRAKQ